MTEVEDTMRATAANFASVVIDGSNRTPVLVDFWASWCAPCHALWPVLERIAGEYAGRVVLAKLNVDEEQAVAAQFGIRSIPTVLLFSRGQVVEQFSGVQPEAAIRALLDRHLPATAGDSTAATDPMLQAHALARAGDLPGAIGVVETALTSHPEQPALLGVLAGLQLSGRDGSGAAATIGRILAIDPQFPALPTLRARLGFLAAVVEWPDEEAVRALLATDPGHSTARHALAAHRALSGDYASAMQEWLELLRRDRGYGDGAARRNLLAVFDLLGSGDERVAASRRRMASLLH